MITQTFTVNWFSFDEDAKRALYKIYPPDKEVEFQYDFYCRVGSSLFAFFDVKRGWAFLVKRKVGVRSAFGDGAECIITGYWISNDYVEFDCNTVYWSRTITNFSKDEFKEKYSSYILDNIINS